MTKAVPSGFYVLRHPNHLLLAGVNNRNVALPNDSKQPLIKQIEIFSGILLYISTVSTFLNICASS